MDETMQNSLECRYFGMCEYAYECYCDGEENTCFNYEPMPNVDELLRLADELKEESDKDRYYHPNVADIYSRVYSSCGVYDRYDAEGE